jgi:rhodanese-related sulfurtransferase/membrane protein DedA with SNARE-associated domain
MTLRTVSPRLLLGIAIVAGRAVARVQSGVHRERDTESGTLGPCRPCRAVCGGDRPVRSRCALRPSGRRPLWAGVGTILNVTGATLGATAAFLIARYVAADWVREKAGAKLERLINGVGAEGWRFVALTRLVPQIPFNLLNYALGVTRIRTASYVLASLISMIPGALAYSWLGYAGREAIAGNVAAIRYGLMGLGLLAAVAFVPRLLRRFKNEGPVRWIEVGELVPRLDAVGTIAVIDVRGPDELAGPLGHIANARNAPLPELPARVAELRALIETPVVLVCKTDRRSASAAAILDEAGFQDVFVLRGGMVRWNETELPVADR